MLQKIAMNKTPLNHKIVIIVKYAQNVNFSTENF